MTSPFTGFSVLFNVHAGGLFLKLHFIQAGIKSVLLQQLFVRAHFFYFTLIQHNNFTGLPDGGKPVGNNNRCSAGNQFVDGVLYQLFTFCIN